MGEREFHSQAYDVLSAWLAAEQFNIAHRAIGFFRLYEWETGFRPLTKSTLLRGSVHDEATTRTTLEALVPHIRMFAHNCLNKRRVDDLATVQKFIAMMRALGVDPDPGRTIDQMAAFLSAQMGLLGEGTA